MNPRVGFGFDSHKLEKALPLTLGGILIDHHSGLVAHSDGDVLVHAIVDAIFGAINKRDIGIHFPDSDPKFKNASSIGFLKEVAKLVAGEGYKIGNIDTTIVASQPKLADIIPEMQVKLAMALGIRSNQISIKASSNNGLGFEGREEGISAYAVCMLF